MEFDRTHFLRLLGAVALAPALVKAEKWLPAPVEAPELAAPIAEGAQIPALPAAAGSLMGDLTVVEVGYETALRAFPAGSFPTLEKAVANQLPAVSPKVEWLVERRGKLRTEHNFTQIFRDSMLISNVMIARTLYQTVTTPDQPSNGPISAMVALQPGQKQWIPPYNAEIGRLRLRVLEDHLQNVENQLVWGRREARETESGFPVRQMGGTIEFRGSKLALRPLRDLVLRRYASGWEDGYREEWLGEVSLQVS